TDGNSLTVLQDLLDKSTLAAEISVIAAATAPFVTSYVTPAPEPAGGEYTDHVFALNFQTKLPAERFVISSGTPHDSNANGVDGEVSSVIKSAVPDPVVLTTVVATTVVAGTSIPQPREVNEPTRANIFTDFTSAGNVGLDVAGPSQLASNDIYSESFYVSLDIDFETLHQTYVLKWDVLNESALDEPNLFDEFNVRAARQTCLRAEVRMRLEHVLRGKKRLEGKCGMQTSLLKERDTEIASLKAQLSLKEAEAAKAIRLHRRIADIETTDATLTGELKSLKERNAALESAAAAKDSEIAKLTQDLSSLQRWILSRGLKLVIMKCLQSSEYMVALGGALGRAIDKSMQEGLKADVDHGRAGRGLDVIAAYDPFVEAKFFSAVDALRAVNLDASMADIFDLLRLEGPAAETPKAS
ncbi:hypothetical protein Tco_1468764, partial [Tanacetum coccineum]